MKKTKSKEEYYSHKEIFSTTYYTFDKIRFYCSQNKSYNQAVMIDIYLFYCKCCSIQETSSVFATNSFVASGLGYEDKTITKYSKALQDQGLIERIVKREGGKIAGHYVLVKFVLKEPDPTITGFESDRCQSHVLNQPPPNTIDIKEEIPIDIKQEILKDINTINGEATENSDSLEDESLNTDTKIRPAAGGRVAKQQVESGLSNYEMCKMLVDLCPSCDEAPNFLLKRVPQWLEKDTWDNILLGYTNYCKQMGKTSKRPTTVIPSGEYKEYILLKEKPYRLTKLESILEYQVPRSSNELDSYGEKKQFFGHTPEEEAEYDDLCIKYYGEIARSSSSFRWI